MPGDFLQFEGGAFDRIVMNPPFEHGQDVDHVRHAFELLKDGGRLVAIMGEHAFFGGDQKSIAFRAWLDELGGSSEQLPSGTFEHQATSTGVASRLVVIDKPVSDWLPKMGDLVEYQGEVWEVGFVNNRTTGWAGTLRLQKSGDAGARSVNRVDPSEVRLVKAAMGQVAVCEEGEKVYELFPFQEEGVAWLKGRNFALLADDMGLGKTPQGIHWGADFRPVLVVVPSALTLNWQREITEMWRKGDSAILLDGTNELPATLPDWTIISYGHLDRYLPRLRQCRIQGDHHR